MKNILYIAVILFAFAACSKDQGVINGAVESSDDISLANVTVKLFDMDSQLAQSTTTDAKGEFQFTDVETGNYYIGATTTVSGAVYDTGNYPQIIYVSGKIVKKVSLSLSKK